MAPLPMSIKNHLIYRSLRKLYRGLRNIAAFFIDSLLPILPLWRTARVIATLKCSPFSPIPPVNLDSLPKDFRVHFLEQLSLPDSRTFSLHNVNVSGAGVVFKNLRIFLPSLCWARDLPARRTRSLLFRQWWGKPKVLLKRTETVVLAHNLWAYRNYYHWIIDTLPRLLMLRENDDLLLIVPDSGPEYIHATVALLGFKRLLPLAMSEFVKVPNLIMLEETAPAGFQNRYLLEALRGRLLSSFLIKPLVPKRKIYVSRSRQIARRLANESSVELILSKYGFETIFFEELTFNEQVNVMLQTSVFISVHGANLTNILFMQPGCRVIEMINSRSENYMYYRIASIANLLYYAIPCEKDNENAEISGDFAADFTANNNADLVVNIGELERVIEAALC